MSKSAYSNCKSLHTLEFALEESDHALYYYGYTRVQIINKRDGTYGLTIGDEGHEKHYPDSVSIEGMEDYLTSLMGTMYAKGSHVWMAIEEKEKQTNE